MKYSIEQAISISEYQESGVHSDHAEEMILLFSVRGITKTYLPESRFAIKKEVKA